MRYAIISDIHGNLEAFKIVLRELEKEHVDKIFCLGDIVGYGPNPNECIELVRKNCEIILTGNHDYACIEQTELKYFNRFAKQAIEWTVANLSKKNLSFISELPYDESIEQFFLVHANPHTPESWDYILSIDDAIFNFSKFDEQICFIGHSHRPIIYIENNNQKYTASDERELDIHQDCRYIINVGSVGQPRDNNPAAAFGIIDTTTQTYELVRVGYNIEETYKKMISSDLPVFLADRLLTGK